MANKQKRFRPVSNPLLDLKEKYGGTWTLKKSKTIKNFTPMLMKNFPSQNHCALTSLTAIFYYYRKQGFIRIPDQSQDIFQDLLAYAESKKFFSPLIGTPVFFFGKIARALWRKYGYQGQGKNSYLFHSQADVEDRITGEIDQDRPAILGITSRLYRRHAITVYGYQVFKKEDHEVTYALVNDNWSLAPRYLELTHLGEGAYSFFCLTRIIP